MGTFGSAYLQADRGTGTWSLRPDLACRNEDPELFFPKVGQRAEAAKALCGGCPALAECRAYGLSLPWNALYGVWGGLSQEERKVAQADGRAPCGTAAGYREHLIRDEATCAACRKAFRRYRNKAAA